MSADGEVEVKVSSDGADEAAEDLSDASATGVGGGGGGAMAGGGQQDLLGRSLKGGALLAGVKIIAELLGPITDYISGVLEVLQAFLAPLSLVIVRLLSPFLQFMVTRVLPAWLSFMDGVMPLVEDAANFISGVLDWVAVVAARIPQLPGLIWALTKQGYQWIVSKAQGIIDSLAGLAGDIWTQTKQGFDNIVTKVQSLIGWVSSLPRMIWSYVQDLPSLIGSAIAERVPSIPDNPVDTATDAAGDAGRNIIERGQRTVVQLQGGLDQFITNVQRSTDYDASP